MVLVVLTLQLLPDTLKIIRAGGMKNFFILLPILTIIFVTISFFYFPLIFFGAACFCAACSGILGIGYHIGGGMQSEQFSGIRSFGTGIHTDTSNNNMRECPFCLKKISVDTNRCKHCWEHVPTTRIKVCYHCGAKISLKSQRCLECHHMV